MGREAGRSSRDRETDRTRPGGGNPAARFRPAGRGAREISWDDFFEKFEDADLAFLYQDKTNGGKPSRFHKFVSRDSVEDEDEDDDEEYDEEDEEEEEEEEEEEDED